MQPAPPAGRRLGRGQSHAKGVRVPYTQIQTHLHRSQSAHPAARARVPSSQALRQREGFTEMELAGHKEPANSIAHSPRLILSTVSLFQIPRGGGKVGYTGEKGSSLGITCRRSEPWAEGAWTGALGQTWLSLPTSSSDKDCVANVKTGSSHTGETGSSHSASRGGVGWMRGGQIGMGKWRHNRCLDSRAHASSAACV